MRFALLPGSCLPFHAKTLDERPLGGTETGVIRMAEALSALGHDVVVFSELPNPPLSHPLYASFRTLTHLGEVDVAIAVRDWKLCLAPIRAKRKLFWTGDAHDQPHTVGIGDRRVARSIHAIMAVSEWHAEMLASTSGYPRGRVWRVPNGIHLDYFRGSEARSRKRLFYSSTPYRGLKYLPEIFREIRKRHPDAELHVFSGYRVYSVDGRPYDVAAEREFDRIAETLRALPGCFVRGNMTQALLAREMMKCAVMAYPNTFAETSCISAMEAQAAGCPIVTSRLGALPETVGDAGILIDGSPESLSYISGFIEAIDSLLSNDELFAKLSGNAIARSTRLDWTNSAQALLSYLS